MTDAGIQLPVEYRDCMDIHIMLAPHDGKFIIASLELEPMIGYGKTPDDWKVIEPDSFLGKEVYKHVRGMIRRREGGAE